MSEPKNVSTLRGFTLLELLVALAISGLVISAVYGFYLAQSRTYATQELLVELENNIRAGTGIMVQDLRLAGCDPLRSSSAGILVAGAQRIQVSMDLNNDGDTGDLNENVTYALFTQNGIQCLSRKGTAIAADAAVAEYVEALGFAYGIDADGNGALDTDGGGIIWATPDPTTGNWFDLDVDDNGQIDAGDDADGDGVIAGQDTGIAAELEDIRSIRIWLLARSPRADRDYTNQSAYIVGNRILTMNDAFRRRLTVTTVTARNLSL